MKLPLLRVTVRGVNLVSLLNTARSQQCGALLGKSLRARILLLPPVLETSFPAKVVDAVHAWRRFCLYWDLGHRDYLEWVVLYLRQLTRLGLDGTMKSLKTWYVSVRRHALKDPYKDPIKPAWCSIRWSRSFRRKMANFEFAFHLSTLARALPEPPPAPIEKYHEYRDVLTGPSTPLDEELASSFTNFVAGHVQFDKDACTIPFSISATNTRSRAEMGLLGYCREKFHPFANGAPIRVHRTGWESQGLIQKQFDALDPTPVGRALILPERGWKYRAITAVDEDLLILTGAVANGIRHSLPTLPGAEAIFKEDSEAATRIETTILKRPELARRSWRSSDWTSSTDYIPFWILTAFVAGLFQAVPMARHIQRAVEIAVGKFHITLPDGSSFVTAKGVLMGTPLSFIILTFLHCWILRETFRRVPRNLRVWFVKGDDSAFPDVRGTSERYTSYLEVLGIRLSVGKDFLSSRAVVFAERAVALTGRLSAHVLHPAMRRLNVSDKESVFPISEQMLWDRPLASRIGRTIALTNHSRRTLYHFTPIEIGGEGIPPRQGLRRWFYRLSRKLREGFWRISLDPGSKELLRMFGSQNLTFRGFSFAFSPYLDKAREIVDDDVDHSLLAAYLLVSDYLRSQEVVPLRPKAFSLRTPGNFRTLFADFMAVERKESSSSSDRDFEGFLSNLREPLESLGRDEVLQHPIFVVVAIAEKSDRSHVVL